MWKSCACEWIYRDDTSPYPVCFLTPRLTRVWNYIHRVIAECSSSTIKELDYDHKLREREKIVIFYIYFKFKYFTKYSCASYFCVVFYVFNFIIMIITIEFSLSEILWIRGWLLFLVDLIKTNEPIVHNISKPVGRKVK